MICKYNTRMYGRLPIFQLCRHVEDQRRTLGCVEAEVDEDDGLTNAEHCLSAVRNPRVDTEKYAQIIILFEALKAKINCR